MTRWLVTGATGLLGANAGLRLGREHEVVGAARTVPADGPFPCLAVDLTDPAQRDGLVERSGADVVLHGAALASLEACEKDPALAQVLNADAAADLAAQAARAGLPFVHVSTDAVFDGTRGGYTEDDEPTPTSAYGRSKLAGERAVLEAHPDALVARVNFYGWSPSGSRSLAEFFYHRLRRGERAPGFTDVRVSTLQVALLVEALERLVARGARGVLHVVSSEATSKYAFGQALARTFGLDAGLVTEATSTQHLSTPRGSRLDLSTDRAAALLGAPLPGQSEGLAVLRAELDQHVPAAVGRLSRGEGSQS